MLSLSKLTSFFLACNSLFSHASSKMIPINTMKLANFFGLSYSHLTHSSRLQIIEALVVPISDVQTRHPELEVHLDPTDFTRLRFVVILQNYKGEMRRLRLIQWNDLNADRWRKISKERSTELAGPESEWAQVLMSSVDSMSPKEVEKLLGRKRS